jgi:hypothetical protein
MNTRHAAQHHVAEYLAEEPSRVAFKASTQAKLRRGSRAATLAARADRRFCVHGKS